MEWGVVPSAYDKLPRATRIEMMKFWAWRLERQRKLREVADLNQKFFGERNGGAGGG